MSEKKPRRKTPTSNMDPVLQQKMDKLIELQKGITILKDRMTLSKKDLLDHFDAHPQLKNSKYVVDNYSIGYLNRKATDSVTQKLIISGLSQYFKSKGLTDLGREVAQIMTLIKDQRQTKIVPAIDIRFRNTSVETSK
jgi:hypothetical protein